MQRNKRLFLNLSVFLTVIVATLAGMAAILIYERRQMQEVEGGVAQLWRMHEDIHTAHRHITDLALLGEAATGWGDTERDCYHTHRMRTDSLLAVLEKRGGTFVPDGEIDTLRHLLAEKEGMLVTMMEVHREQRKRTAIGRKLAKELPGAVAEATLIRQVTVKKKGIAGWLGGRKTVQSVPDAGKLHDLNERMASLDGQYPGDFEIQADSLMAKNEQLNRRLVGLVNRLDDVAEAVFLRHGRELDAIRVESFKGLAILSGLAIALLAVSSCIIYRDVRRRERDKEKLEDSVERYNSLLETRKKIILTISHDIRGPLNAVYGNVELAADTREKKKRDKYLRNVRMQCRHILHLLNNMLDMYRLNAAKETANNVPFRLGRLLEQVASDTARIVNDKGLLFVPDFNGTDVTVCGDTDRIGQILDNLLGNAVKFTTAGSIGFSAEYADGQLTVEVSDTGIGMSEETVGRIFLPFERSADSANVEGFGLGLSITKGLVSLLGGSIDIVSNVGKGTVFHVALPLPLTQQPTEDDTSICGYEPDDLPGSVLVIDDDPLQLEVVREMLERNGVSCAACTCVQDVIREMRGRDFDLLLTDIQMGGTNGFELLTLLRNSNIGNSRTIPVVAMTARGENEKDAFIKAGFTECIYKPFSSTELLALLASVMKSGEGNTSAPDFSTLLSEVRDKAALLRSFIAQSEKDIADLNAAIKSVDRKVLRDTVHRMLPMWELLHVGKRLSAYHSLLKNKATGDDKVREHTRKIMEYASMLAAEAEEEIKKLRYEKENTDS